jgi:protein SCO1
MSEVVETERLPMIAMQRRMTFRQWPLLLIGLTALAIFAGALLTRTSSAQQPLAQLQGTILLERLAPNFTLRDQFGDSVTLASQRGHPVLLTFMEANCKQLCPTVAEKIHRVLKELGSGARRITVLAISTDPVGDTPTNVRQFSRRHGLLHRWLYLIGSRAALTKVWKSYYVYAAPAWAPVKIRDSHTSASYLIDSQGRERVLMGGDPDEAALVADLRLLAHLPSSSSAELALPAPEAGHPAPNFTLRVLTGNSLALQSLRGRPVLLTFWATWCRACQSEFPQLERWYRVHHGRNPVIVGVDQQESRATVLAYVRRYGVSYPILLDESGDVSARYDVAWLPKSLAIDAQGIVQYVKLGAVTSGDLARAARTRRAPA